MEKKPTIVLIGGPKLPIPPTMGGAVQALVWDGLIKRNEETPQAHFVVFSPYEEKAALLSQGLKETEFVYIRPSSFSCLLDKAVSLFLKLIGKSKRLISYGYIFRTLSYCSKAKRFLKRIDARHYVVENSVPTFRALKRVLRNGKNKVFFHSHALPSSLYGSRKIFKRASGILAVSNYIADAWHRLLPGVDTAILHNCIDPSTFTPARVPSNEKVKILCVARISPEKGILELLRAYSRMTLRRQVELTLAGAAFYETKMMTEYEKQAIDFIKENRLDVKLLGHVPYSKIPELYQKADIVVVPSTGPDAAPLAAIEALSCGKALVTSNSGGIPEYVSDAAIVLPLGEQFVDRLARTLDELAGNECLRNSFKGKAIERATQFNIKGYLDGFLTAIGISQGGKGQ